MKYSARFKLLRIRSSKLSDNLHDMALALMWAKEASIKSERSVARWAHSEDEDDLASAEESLKAVKNHLNSVRNFDSQSQGLLDKLLGGGE